MKIECSNCHATYEVAENAIPPEGREVQCAKCDHVWLAFPMPSTPEPEPAPAPMPLVQQTPVEPEPSFEASVENPLPEPTISVSEDVADTLRSEAEFARDQRVDDAIADEETGSPLENLRRRVIDENPQQDPMPELETAAPDELIEAPSEPDVEEPAAKANPFSRAALGVRNTPSEPDNSEAPVEEPAEATPQEEIPQTEPVAEPAESSPFRRLGASKPDTEVAPEEPQFEEVPAVSEEVAPVEETPPAPAPEAPKRKRQSLAEISASSAPPQIDAGEMPATKPIDLGPASPEERPETPFEEDVNPRTLEVPRSESIAKPDMSQDAIAQRALEELDSIETKEVDKKRSLAGGFSLGLLVFVLLMFIFSFGPVIGEAVPFTEPFFTAYHNLVEQGLNAVGIDLAQVGATLAGWLEAIQ